MTYEAVYERTESLLLAMVAEGLASHAGVGRHGPTFVVDLELACERMEAAGLLGDDMPWTLPVAALRRLACLEAGR